MEEEKELALLQYFENLNLPQATFFYYRYIAKQKRNDVAVSIDRDPKTVGGYITATNKAFQDLGLDPTDPDVHHLFRRIAPGPPSWDRWPPPGYIRPTHPRTKPKPIAQPQPEPRLTRNSILLAVLIAIALVLVIVIAAIIFTRTGQEEILGTAIGIAPEPSQTPIPTDTLPPTATEDRMQTVAAVVALTAAALPTVDLVATDVKATQDHLTSIAPTPVCQNR